MDDRSETARLPGLNNSLLPQAIVVAGAGICVGLLVFAVRGAALPPAPLEASTSCEAPSSFDQEPVRVSAAEAHGLVALGEASFVDCRSAEEYQQGHIAGAVSLPAEALPLTADAQDHLSGASLVITYCDEACSRSSRVANHIIESGFADVRILTGGMSAWLEAGYPAESGACPLCATTASEPP